MDFGAIGGLVASLKAASDVTKAAVTIRDAVVLHAKIIELQGLIMAAQSSAMSAQIEHFEAIEQLRAVRAELDALRGWEAEKARYGLTPISKGVFVLLLRDEAANGEPKHAICTACAEKGLKSVLQSKIDAAAIDTLTCPSCKTAIVASTENPDYPFGASRNFAREQRERGQRAIDEHNERAGRDSWLRR